MSNNSSCNMPCWIISKKCRNNWKNLRQQIGRNVVSYWSYSLAELITGLLRRPQQLFAIQTASRHQATVVTVMDGQRSRRRNLKVKPAPRRRLESPTATAATSVTLGNKRGRTTREWGKCGRTASMSTQARASCIRSIPTVIWWTVGCKLDKLGEIAIGHLR